MKFLKFSLLLISLSSFGQNNDSLMLRKIYDFYLTESKCYKSLEVLCKTIGPRLSGSKNAEQAVYWAKKAMYNAGADTVYLQPCMVTHWERGEKEKCEIRFSKQKSILPLNLIALGGSVATPVNGLNAPVIEVKSFEELEQLGEKNIKGKVVFYNVFFNPKNIRTGTSYGETVKYRYDGPSKAAKYGAVATVVRSMSSSDNDSPHTGVMKYDSTVSLTKIPAFALSFKAADLLSENLKKDAQLSLYLKSNCKSFPDAPSFNVIGEIKGSEKPNEYIITGGHLDSWDNGEGAHDDGAGVVQSIEALAMFKKLGVKPKHSIRAVAFMNEENGLGGGKAYGKEAEVKKLKHIAAIETDAGGFTPRGFGVDTTAGMYQTVSNWLPLFKPYFITYINQGGGGADIGPLEKQGVPCIGYEPDGQRYFDIHHTADDTFDKVNKRELELGAAAIGSLMYLIDKYR
ncbi:MAG: M20/M25/M40 family metallo-hydrolase [Bacteroidetes bacterium]|nr:M20/M25/M40 family metallo-hydrolase [Bacteroidota bacterium]